MNINEKCSQDLNDRLIKGFNEGFNEGFENNNFTNNSFDGGGEEDEDEEVQYMKNVGHYIRAMTDSSTEAVNYLQTNG